MSPLRTILITGSTDGIGRQTAVELAKNSENHVIIHGRNEQRCQTAIEYIKSAGGTNVVDYVIGDFGHMKQVAQMANVVVDRFPKLNVLIANAGVLNPKREISADGLEMTFQVNHLAHFLLANRLLDRLKENAPSRIIFVSSICHAWHEMNWDDLQAEKYEKYQQYSRTKLANHLFTFALDRRLKGTRVSCNVLEPGVIDTKLLHNGGFTGAPVGEGCVAATRLAQDPAFESASGCYFDRLGKKITPCKESLNEADQEKLWEISVDLCKKLGVWK